jgi:hypothetical protein
LFFVPGTTRSQVIHYIQQAPESRYLFFPRGAVGFVVIFHIQKFLQK